MLEKSLEFTKLAVIGLGYVGLPLAVEFGKHIVTIGFDIDSERISALADGFDSTLEVTTVEMAKARKVEFTSERQKLTACNVYIVTVPTPVDVNSRPDFSSLQAASKLVGSLLSPGNTVIYESTVYPGATEEVCVPILEAESGLSLNIDFYTGYSPERINPGDKDHRLPDIVKITSGSCPDAADFIDWLYRLVIQAGTFKASSIKVAEAAKVIENTQRDLNIALINELAIIFNRLNIDTEEILLAASTKWNFLPFRPGLVGGHCIGVDPYYLTHKAEEVGYHPEVILAGRRINDGMGAYTAGQVVKLMLKKRIHIVDARILVMGLTFKEDCQDIRNTQVVSIITEFESLGATVDVYDPWVDAITAQNEYGVKIIEYPAAGSYDAIVVAVGHSQFKAMSAMDMRAFGKTEHVLYDVKYILRNQESDGRL